MRRDVTLDFTSQSNFLYRALSLTLLLLCATTISAQLTAAEMVTLTESSPVLSARISRSAQWPGGDVLLLLHGTLSHRDTEIIASLEMLFQEAGASTVAINLSLGIDEREGLYDCTGPQRHREDDATRELARWMTWLDGEGVASVTLLGHSRGANQIARFQLQNASARVQRLILIAPPRYDADSAARAYETRYGTALATVLERAAGLAERGNGGDLLPGNTGFLYCGELPVSADSFLSYYTPQPLRDTPTLLAQLQLPVLVVAGSEDEIASGLPEALSGGAENIRLREIDGADHFFRDLYAYDLVDEALDFMDDTR